MLQVNKDQVKYIKVFLQRYKEIRPILIDIIYESSKLTNEIQRLKGQQDIIALFDEIVKE